MNIWLQAFILVAAVAALGFYLAYKEKHLKK
jgi:hypothetical protein